MPEINTLGFVIKPTYEDEPDTNDFNDAAKAKLAGIEAGAQVNAVLTVNGQTGNVVITNAVTSVNGQTGTVVLVKADIGLSNVDNTSDANKPISTATQAALDLKAPIASPTFTGTVSGVTAAMVGLGNVNNTSDANKPVSTAQQTALDLKAPLASPTFTGTVSGITKAMVGLGNVDNTSDANKPVSTAQQTALNLKLTSDPTGVSGAAAITNIMSLTSAQYAAIGAPNASTLYVITDA